MLATLNRLFRKVPQWLTGLSLEVSGVSIDSRTHLALIYLALPNIVFLLGWLRPCYGIAASLLLVFSITPLLCTGARPLAAGSSPVGVIALIVSGAAWASLSGGGHFFHAVLDWQVRDTVYADLIISEWPPSYGLLDGKPLILRSAIGYFLPPAAVAKLIGISTAPTLLFLWTALGCVIFLSLLPLPEKPGMKGAVLIAIPMLFSGMDYLGIFLSSGTTPIFPIRMEWWCAFSYSSLSGQLLWAPNHALPIWIGSALFFRHWGNPSIPALLLILMPLLLLWTPFATIGLLPYVLLAVLRWARNPYPIRLNPIALLNTLILGLLMYRLFTMGIDQITSMPTFGNTMQHGNDSSGYWKDYILFVLMEFGLIALALGRLLSSGLGLLALSTTILALLPFYQLGPSNDSLLRLSTSPLIFIMLLIIQRLREGRLIPGQGLAAGSLAMMLAIGALTPIYEISRVIMFRKSPPNFGKSLTEQHGGYLPPHYIGQLSRPDMVELLKPPQRVPEGKERQERLSR